MQLLGGEQRDGEDKGLGWEWARVSEELEDLWGWSRVSWGTDGVDRC